MSVDRRFLLLAMALLLAACAVAGLGFDHLNYPVTTKKMIGKLVLIVPQAATQKQFTVPASVLAASNDQIVLAGQMLVKVADYEYPQMFSSYDRVSAMSDIPPGFYRAIMRLYVANFRVENHGVEVVLHADIYSYQGKLLYEKAFTGKAPLSTDLQAAALIAYRDAIQQINDRLEQLLYWEDHADAGRDNVQAQ
jgi:hypothetical protein